MPSKDASLKQFKLTFSAMFSPPSPLLVETDLIVLVQEMLSRSIQFHRLEHWIMNMSKLVGRCWILLTLSLSKLTKEKVPQNDQFSICETLKNRHIVPCESTVEEVSFGHTFSIVLVFRSM